VKNVPFIGDYTAMIAPADLNRLALAVESHGLFASAAHPCEKCGVLDAPVVSVSVTRDTQLYGIDSGTYYGAAALVELATIIDGLIFEAAWVENSTSRLAGDRQEGKDYAKIVLAHCKE